MRIKSLVVLLIILTFIESSLFSHQFTKYDWIIQQDGDHTLTYSKYSEGNSISFTFDAGDNTFALVFMGQDLFDIFTNLDDAQTDGTLQGTATAIATILKLPPTIQPIQTFPAYDDEIKDAFSFAYNIDQLVEIIRLLQSNVNFGNFFNGYTTTMALQAQHFALAPNPVFAGLRVLKLGHLPDDHFTGGDGPGYGHF